MDVLSQQEPEIESNLQEISREIFLDQKRDYWIRIGKDWDIWCKIHFHITVHDEMFAGFTRTMAIEDLEFGLRISEHEKTYGKPNRDAMNERFAVHVKKELDNRIIEVYLLGEENADQKCNNEGSSSDKDLVRDA
jgi:hypothetical protein